MLHGRRKFKQGTAPPEIRRFRRVWIEQTLELLSNPRGLAGDHRALWPYRPYGAVENPQKRVKSYPVIKTGIRLSRDCASALDRLHQEPPSFANVREQWHGYSIR